MIPPKPNANGSLKSRKIANKFYKSSITDIKQTQSHHKNLNLLRRSIPCSKFTVKNRIL